MPAIASIALQPTSSHRSAAEGPGQTAGEHLRGDRRGRHRQQGRGRRKRSACGAARHPGLPEPPLASEVENRRRDRRCGVFSSATFSTVVPIIQGSTQGADHGSQHTHRALPQHRHRRPRRRRQDHDDRADPLLHRRQPQDGRGPRRRGDHGLDGAGAGTRHHHHLGGDHRLLAGLDQAVSAPLSLQHHRYPRPRRLHHRGGTLAARARRGGGGVQRRRRRRAAVRDGLAAGQQIPRAAPGLREQDGSPGCRLSPCGGADQAAPGAYPGADPAGDRRGGELQRPGRPGEDEGHLLERRRPGHQLPRGRDPGGACARWPRSGGRTWSRPPPRPTTS